MRERSRHIACRWSSPYTLPREDRYILLQLKKNCNRGEGSLEGYEGGTMYIQYAACAHVCRAYVEGVPGGSQGRKPPTQSNAGWMREG